MKVLIDGHMLGTGEGGNERYIENLALALIKQKHVETSVLVPASYQQFSKNIKQFYIREKTASNIMRILCTLPKLAKKINADIVHSTYVGPIIGSAKLVLTVHDFIFKSYPEYFSTREKLIFNCLLPFSMHKAAAIIVPSDFVKEELVRYYPRHANKVFVTHEAAAEKFKIINSNSAKNRIMKKFDIKSPFILAFNGKYAKRNINRVIDAHTQVGAKFPDLQLVILGGKDNINRKIKSKKIRILKNIPDADLVLLYNAAKAVIYYSVYEGFGLPILEAFSCGTSVIASNISVHREVAGNAAFYANPQDARDLAKKIVSLINNPRMAKKMGKKGYKKALEYSWEKTAKSTIKAYKFALKSI